MPLPRINEERFRALVENSWEVLLLLENRASLRPGEDVELAPRAIAGALAALPTSAGWPLHHGFGGILGGEDTGCTPETKNILIECAYFDPLRTAATGRKAGVQSDARYRFERGVDPAFIKPGLDLARPCPSPTARVICFSSCAIRRPSSWPGISRLPRWRRSRRGSGAAPSRFPVSLCA